MLTDKALRGFTLIEMMVAIALMAILLTAATPGIQTWQGNARVRSVADALQNAIRQAQAEALSRGQQTVFVLTNATTPLWNSAPATNGVNWKVHAQPLSNSAEATAPATAATFPYIDGSTLAKQYSVSITGPSTLCFNSMGRVIPTAAVTIPGAGSATCSTVDPTTQALVYTLSKAQGADRRYQVWVYAAGKVRMCDADKKLSSSAPDGCP